MMRPLSVLCSLLFATTLAAFSQTTFLKIDGVSEPPELSGEPKKVGEPTEAERQLGEIVSHLKDQVEAKSTLPTLNKFIEEHPDDSDAYFLRATCAACILDSRDFASMTSDVEAAMSHSGANVYNKTDYYSLLGKIAIKSGEYGRAMDDLEQAMRRDLSTASRMFNIEGVEPERTSKSCSWNLTDMDTLVAKFPRDYRASLFRGLYYEFFTTFKETYYEKAMQEFQKAALLSPNNSLPMYFMGQVHTKASFWTQKAWASDTGRDDATRNAVQAYTKAIQLEPKFLPAYEERASGYLNLKQYSHAISDYERILALDPENAMAYADGGLAKLETAQYNAAIFDFGAAIRLKGEGDSYLPNLYEYRGDANFKLGRYKDSIADYSKAIERQLASETFLLSLTQFRTLYSEYDNVSDEALVRKINALFWPQFEYKVFAKQVMEKSC